MWNLKYNTKEPIYEIETESGTWLPRGRGGEGVEGRLRLADVNFIHRMDK